MDRRDMMRDYPPDQDGFCESEMTFHIEIENWELECPAHAVGVACNCDYCTDIEGSSIHVLPARYEVCTTCRGKGKHVNPSIDAHGISREEFDEDPDFMEDYLSGFYDVTCYECHGKRVVPVIDDARLTEEQRRVSEIVEGRARANHECDTMTYMERMRGA